MPSNEPCGGVLQPMLRKGQLCLAKFSGDGEWYRASVIAANTRDPTRPSYQVATSACCMSFVVTRLSTLMLEVELIVDSSLMHRLEVQASINDVMSCQTNVMVKTTM
jgi:hypothetical protein